MKKNLLILFIALLGFSTAAFAQSRNGLKINEVMVSNETNAIDEFGERVAWIELFNSTHASLEISSVYITNDKNNPTKYPVPLFDVNTKIPKRQHVIFWADGKPSRGTFHLNFTLKAGEENWIGVYDADGKTLIDEVTIPANLGIDESYARSEDGKGEWEIRNDVGDKYITPSSNNVIRDINDKIETFKTKDSHGFAMTLMAMGVVFSALIVLCLCFLLISKIGSAVARRNKRESIGNGDEIPGALADSGEEIAAIVMALHEHLDTHDNESMVLTINKVRRSYSPWSSKIYGLRRMPK